MNETNDYVLDDFEEEYSEEYVTKLNNKIKSYTGTITNSLDDFNQDNQPSYKSEVVLSNLDYINEHMSSLHSKINNAVGFYDNNHLITSSNAKNVLFNSFNDMLNQFYNGQTLLMEKLNNEVNFIVSTGEEFDRLDKELKKKAGSL